MRLESAKEHINLTDAPGDSPDVIIAIQIASQAFADFVSRPVKPTHIICLGC